MRVHLGADHAGFSVKAHFLRWLPEHGYQPVDHGAHSYHADDDYPTFCLVAAAAVAADPGSLGVVLGGSGNGEAIAANKVDGVRAALAWDRQTAELARRHNDATVLSLGARMLTVEAATELLAVFLTTPFSGEARHRRRIAALARYEAGRSEAGRSEAGRSEGGRSSG